MSCGNNNKGTSLTFSSESDGEEDDDEGHHEDLESDFRKLEMERGEQGQGRASLRSTGRHLFDLEYKMDKLRQSR